ncbi:DEAD/DEAH box helicase [Vibrio antiquarius]|uniref:DEAD/DEAH box helicase n=1 Tax=Vibrio antiquarius (strain Ex25) TaxID=150340 RepID=UPI0026588B7E|nr:AAA domain-containing protein [Vibrio antiquarius]MCR9932580.1 AAA domain-containing protein [Vibrio antiquarius]
MNLLDSKCLAGDVIELIFEDQNDANLNWKVGEEVELFFEIDSYYVKQGKRDFFAEVKFKNTSLAMAVSGSKARKVCAVSCYKNSRALAIRYVDLIDSYDEDIGFKIEPIFIEAIQKQVPSVLDTEGARKWFNEEFVFVKDDKGGIFIEFPDNSKDSFFLIGKDYKVLVDKVRKNWHLSSVRHFDGGTDKLYAYYGNHSLELHGIEEQLNSSNYNHHLEQHLQDNASYFKLWQKYSDLHWEQHSRLAKAVGFLEYESVYRASDTEIRFKFKVGDKALKLFFEQYKSELEVLGETFSLSEVELQIAQDLPSWLTSTESFEKVGTRPVFLSRVKIEGDFLVANLNQRPKPKGFIFISLNGIKKQHERKKIAFDLLKDASNPMPQLKYILEGVNPPELKVKKLRAITPTLKKKLDGKSLTIKQERAVKVALNTPDVALIIGPPGTGKTQVISAIQHRIAEEGNKYNLSLKHQVLLTSYQHDAVDNVVTRSGVFGLPAIKVGGKKDEVNHQQTNSIDTWTGKIVDDLKPNIEKEIQNSDEFKLVDAISSLVFQIKNSNNAQFNYQNLIELQSIQKKLATEYGLKVSVNTERNVDRLIEQFSISSSYALTTTQKQDLVTATRALRTNSTSYDDDGTLRLTRLISLLKDVKGGDYDLEKLKSMIDIGADIDFEFLKSTQNQLLDALQEKFVLPNQRWLKPEQSKLLSELIEELEASLVNSPRLGQLYYRKKYLDALLFEKKQVHESLKEYSAVLGATCQQAAGDAMVGIKSVEHSKNIQFDSVIVDEAARANPLDLMIPMSMARKRVVLVGDHRQLPHMLEPRVEKELQDNNELEIIDHELLQQSLFERLYLSLSKYEKERSTEHKRVVMLDTQFRMHPELGSFVSEEFYEMFGLPPVKPGLDESHFPLDVPGYEGKLAAWIDVEPSKGRMSSKNGSKYRDCEAEIIADEAYKILTARPDLSVGIITFYAAQRDHIIEKMVDRKIMEYSSTSSSVLSEFRMTKPNSGGNPEERFRVGSVDAFQGKEFDVVLLSTVRSWNEPDEITQETVNAQLGFLRIPNRINVAMSRQKRLLIVVGDTSLASNNLNQFMPESIRTSENEKILVGFPKFFNELCKKEKGIVF